MKKLVQKVSVLLASVMLLASCGSTGEKAAPAAPAAPGNTAAADSGSSTSAPAAPNAAAASPVTLTLWADFTTPERTEYVERMVAAYMTENPNVKIELTPLPDSADDKVLMAYEAGQGPDVFLSSGPDITTHINGDYVIPLDQYFDKWDKKDQILSSAIDTVRQYDIKGNNNLYYIPNGISFTVMWVRSDWLKETNSAVDTWNNLFTAVENMTDKANKKFGLSIRGGKGGAKFLERMMYSYSGILSVFDENGKCTINDPKNVEFVDKYLSLYKKNTSEGDINYGWTELSAAFDSGAAGLIIHNLGSANDHVKAFNDDRTKFEAIGMPLNDNKTSVNLMIQPGGMTISSTCKDPQAAFDFVSYMTTGEPVSEYCQQWGVVPVDEKVLESAKWIDEQSWYRASADLLLDDSTLFYNAYSWLPDHDSIYGEMDTQSQFVMSGEMTAKEMLDAWAAHYQKCYDAFYKK